mgnify:CR=1 FL=1
MINISGKNKAKVLAALYNASHPQGLGILHLNPVDMDQKQAAELLKDRAYFDYLMGRVMRVDLSGDSFDEWGYDRGNGIGAAQRAVNSA